jgi:hypothetical protein
MITLGAELFAYLAIAYVFAAVRVPIRRDSAILGATAHPTAAYATQFASSNMRSHRRSRNGQLARQALR